MHDVLPLFFVPWLHALQIVASIGYDALQLSMFPRLDAHLIFTATAHVVLPLFFVLRLGALQIFIVLVHELLLFL